MYHVSRFDEGSFAVPHGYADHSRGYARATLIDRAAGSVHMGVGICQLEPSGHVRTAIHANEKGVYVLEGELALRRGTEQLRLAADDYALIPYGTPHGCRNDGGRAVRWLEMQAPQPKPPGGWQDFVFVEDDAAPVNVPGAAPAPAPGKAVGRFKPVNPMAPQVDGVKGLSVYRFMEREFGSQQFFMMRGELAPGGFRSRHDHPVEEFYFALDGESFMDIENERFHLRRGDVAWTGVGTSHAFCHTGTAPFRWLETQAPQFPARNGTRNYSDWDKLRAPG